MKALIADDDVTTRHLLRATLAQWGYEVVEATNGEEAWAHFTGPAPASLAIVDWMMPELSGPELCHRLQKNPLKPAPYIILLTSKTEWQDLVRGLGAGADDYITKPYNLAELRARLDVGRRLVGLQQEMLEVNHRLEHRVQERTEEIQQLLRLNQELIVQLGHDLRTSLTPLVALLPLLAADELDEERRESIRLCLEPVQHLRRLADRVFEFGRIDAGPPPLTLRAIALHTLARAALDELEAHDHRDVSPVALDVPPDLLVHGESARLQGVFKELLENALRFSPAGSPIRVTAERAGDHVVVSVTDQGRGLAPDQLERVFAPFYTGDAARHDRRANGLGLTLCRRVIERHGGRIWAEIGPDGRGARLRFRLPLVRPAADA